MMQPLLLVMMFALMLLDNLLRESMDLVMNNMKEGAYAAGSSVGTGSTYATGYTPLVHTNYGSFFLDLGMLLELLLDMLL